MEKIWLKRRLRATRSADGLDSSGGETAFSSGSVSMSSDSDLEADLPPDPDTEVEMDADFLGSSS